MYTLIAENCTHIHGKQAIRLGLNCVGTRPTRIPTSPKLAPDTNTFAQVGKTPR